MFDYAASIWLRPLRLADEKGRLGDVVLVGDLLHETRTERFLRKGIDLPGVQLHGPKSLFIP